MTISELEQRLATFQDHHALERIEISERDVTTFQVALTLKPNIPIPERLILRFEQAIGGSLKSLLLLRTPASFTVLRFTVPRSATDDETPLDRVEEAALVSYFPIASTKTSTAARSGAAKLASATISFASKDRPSRGKVSDAASIKRADMVLRINRS